MKAPAKKPRGVPAAATFHEEWGEWILGKKVGGKCVGEWRQWHATKGHLTCIDVFDGKGRLQHVTRFHPDGTFSQKVPHRNGKPHGVAHYQRSRRASTERVMQNIKSPRIFSFQLFWKHGEQTYPARFFDRDGNEVSLLGKPKPPGLTDAARTTQDGRWGVGKEELQEKYKGHTRLWRATGELAADEVRDRAGRIVKRVEYHPDGSVAKQLDYKAKRGEAFRAAGRTDVDQKELVGDIHRVRFELRIVNATTGLYNAQNHEYFAKDGTKLTAGGKPVVAPPAGAIAVTGGSWMKPERYWLSEALDARGRKHGTSRYVREDGSPYLELDHERGKLVALRQFDDRGARVLEERFHRGRLDRRKRPVVASLAVQLGKERHEVTCDGEGRCTSFAVYRGNRRVSTLDNAKLRSLTPERFAKELERRYGKLIQRGSGLRLAYGYCEILRLEFEHFDEYVKLSTLTGDGGGNSAVLVREGKYKGRVYFLDHEEGLFALDCLDEFLEEEGIDAAALGRDALVEKLPFFQNPLADSLDAFFTGLCLRSRLTHYGELDKLRPS